MGVRDPFRAAVLVEACVALGVAARDIRQLYQMAAWQLEVVHGVDAQALLLRLGRRERRSSAWTAPSGIVLTHVDTWKLTRARAALVRASAPLASDGGMVEEVLMLAVPRPALVSDNARLQRYRALLGDANYVRELRRMNSAEEICESFARMEAEIAVRTSAVAAAN